MPYVKQKPKSEWFCKEPNCNAPTKGYGDFCLKCVAKHRSMSGTGNPNYKTGKYIKRCVVCNKKITAKDRDTCSEHTWIKVEYLERCEDCGEFTKGYGVRCPGCNNRITTSTPEFKQSCSERMKIRVAEPGYREKISIQVKQRYIDNPEQWANRKSGSEHHMYNPNLYGRDWVKYCIDCKVVPLSRSDAERCQDCNFKFQVGPNNPNYVNGESNKGYIGFTEPLKQEIRLRDNHKCQLCSMENDEHLLLYNCSLPVHHIDYDKSNPSKSNLITLCIQCHMRTNYDRLQWQSYFQTNFAQQLGVLI